MDIGWNFRREHLQISQRSHNVISSGGDQPNVVPEKATTWYYLREVTVPRIKEMRAIADRIARGAAMMTDTTVTPKGVGSAWPQHFNKPLAEALQANIVSSGMPAWDDNDQTLAKALRRS